jgi:transcriptional regulator
MAGKKKGRLTKDQLVKLAAEGLTLREIAKKDGTTKANVGQKLRRIRQGAVRHIARDEKRGKAIVQHNIDAGINRLVAIAEIELERDNEDPDPKIAYNLLQQIISEFHKNQDIVFRASAEIREQIRLQLDIFKVWYSHQAIQEFQRIVLDALGSVDSELRDRVIKKLHNKQLVR